VRESSLHKERCAKNTVMPPLLTDMFHLGGQVCVTREADTEVATLGERVVVHCLKRGPGSREK
jgi:hypothetical protein